MFVKMDRTKSGLRIKYSPIAAGEHKEKNKGDNYNVYQ